MLIFNINKSCHLFFVQNGRHSECMHVLYFSSYTTVWQGRSLFIIIPIKYILTHMAGETPYHPVTLPLTTSSSFLRLMISVPCWCTQCPQTQRREITSSSNSPFSGQHTLLDQYIHCSIGTWLAHLPPSQTDWYFNAEIHDLLYLNILCVFLRSSQASGGLFWGSSSLIVFNICL